MPSLSTLARDLAAAHPALDATGERGWRNRLDAAVRGSNAALAVLVHVTRHGALLDRVLDAVSCARADLTHAPRVGNVPTARSCRANAHVRRTTAATAGGHALGPTDSAAIGRHAVKVRAGIGFVNSARGE